MPADSNTSIQPDIFMDPFVDETDGVSEAITEETGVYLDFNREQLNEVEANRAVKAMKRIEAQMAAINAQADAEINDVNQRRKEMLDPLAGNLEHIRNYYMPRLHDMVKANDGKTVKLLNGSVKLSRETWSGKIEDPAQMLQIIRATFDSAMQAVFIKPEEVVPEQPVWGEIKKQTVMKRDPDGNPHVVLAATGEMLDGIVSVEVKEPEVKIDYK